MSITPDSVRELLNSQDFGDRMRGVNQLRQLEPAIAFDLIQAPVNDNNVRVRYAAVSQLASLGSQDLEASLKLLKAGLHDPEPDIQAASADAIGALHLTQAYDDLEQLFRRTPEWIVQFSLVAALGELGEARAFDLLAEVLQSENELLRTAAIGSLGELGDERAVELLAPFANDPDWQTRYRVMQAMARFKTAAARSTLETLTQDEVTQVADQAKLALQG